jgi:hypothetical protein
MLSVANGVEAWVMLGEGFFNSTLMPILSSNEWLESDPLAGKYRLNVLHRAFARSVH